MTFSQFGKQQGNLGLPFPAAHANPSLHIVGKLPWYSMDKGYLADKDV